MKKFLPDLASGIIYYFLYFISAGFIDNSWILQRYFFLMNRRHLLAAVPLLIILILSACDNSSTDSDIDEGIFPAENLENTRQYALEENRGRALIVWHKGEVIYEEYGENFDGRQLHPIWSGSKSFAGILAALAVKNGLFTFDTTLGELIPEWDPQSERGKITIRQLLNLTSGIETTGIGNTQTAEEWLAADMAYERGTTFTYGPTPFYVLSWIFVEVLEINPVDYLNSQLFRPLGLVRGEWSNMDLIYPNLSFGANYPALDWLQVGIMLMNNGTLDGTEILPLALIQQLLTPTEVAPGYGITFWLNKPINRDGEFAMRIPGTASAQDSDKLISDIMPEDLFMMSGAFGQKLYICPSLNLVIVRYGVVFLGNMSDEEFFSRLMDGVDQAALE